MTDDDIEPFELPVDEAALADLRDRLRRTRWPHRETVEDWSQGTPLAVVQRLAAYWADGYDWPARAARLQEHPHFRTTIGGLGVHFVHARSPEPDATPLLMTHGWPGSVAEFHEVIGPLSDPVAHGGSADDAFHVVCPSLPGYGWSDAPTGAGFGVVRIAETWAALMARLGYDRYGAQGGDWGASVTTALGALDAEHLVGIHLNMPLVFGRSPAETPEEEEMAGDLGRFLGDGAGYQAIQSTRPQSVGYGLVDSPAGLLAWITEKLWAWSDHDGDIGSVFTDDQILDDVMHYWLPGTGASSARLYWETARGLRPEPVTAPVGCSIFPKEIFRTSERWADEHFADLRYFNALDRGGHFAAFEQPALFVDEIRACFRAMRG